mmetsp:Transcript_35691/g.74247  ORF Transcript_35691/g.74247 Transcript_35691/m.74247 type:complete len:264 (-) Transcript_35691:879-1670(-)
MQTLLHSTKACYTMLLLATTAPKALRRGALCIVCQAVQQLATVHVRTHSRQESRELKAGANAGILLKVVLVGMVLRTVHQLEPSIGEVCVELGMVGGILLDDRAVDFVRNQRDIRSQAHGPSKLAGFVPGVPLVSAIRALCRDPLFRQQGIEEVIVPARRATRPRALEARGHGVLATACLRTGAAGAIRRSPQAARRGLEVGAHVVVRSLCPLGAGEVAVAVGSAKGVTTADEGHGLAVGPAHAITESVSDLQGTELRRAVVY